MSTLYTIGHSNQSEENFIEHLVSHGITAVADVRSAPYSKYTPQFNRENISRVLKSANIAYVFLGNYLGARPNDPVCVRNGRIDFKRLSKTDYFCEGLERVQQGIKKLNVALMCTEKDPLDCHRTILVCRNLRVPDLKIQHILENGELEDNALSEMRLLEKLDMDPEDLFKRREEIIEEAYDLQGSRIACRVEDEIFIP